MDIDKEFSLKDAGVAGKVLREISRERYYKRNDKPTKEWKEALARKVHIINEGTKSGALTWKCIRSTRTERTTNELYECDSVVFGVAIYPKNLIVLLWPKQQSKPKEITRKRSEAMKIIFKIYENVKQYSIRDDSTKESFYQKSAKSIYNKRRVGLADFVVKTKALTCRDKNHKTKDITAVITIIDSNMVKREVEVNAAYCPKCKCYFLLDDDFRKLKEKGILLCKIIEHNVFYKEGAAAFNMSAESALKQFGYNVSEKDGLSDRDRQHLLSVLLDQQILTRQEILKYLNFFVSLRSEKSIYKNAINKWKTDIEFVKNYKFKSGQKVHVDTIKIRNYNRTD